MFDAFMYIVQYIIYIPCLYLSCIPYQIPTLEILARYLRIHFNNPCSGGSGGSGGSPDEPSLPNNTGVTTVYSYDMNQVITSDYIQKNTFYVIFTIVYS